MPADAYQRQQQLLRLLFRHHPSSAEGHPERFAYVRAAVAAAGYAGELRDLVAASEWQEGIDPTGPKFLGRHRAAATPVEYQAPATAFLTRHLPLSRLSRHEAEAGALACGMDGGAGSGGGVGLTLRSPPLEPKATTAQLLRRVGDLLAQQACLEKWLVASGASLGAYVALLRREVSEEDWTRFSAALLRPYRVPAEGSAPLYAAYIELAARYELGRCTGAADGAACDGGSAGSAGGEDVTVGDWVDGLPAHS